MIDTTNVARIEVFFVPEWDVWSITSYDAQCYQVGDSDYAPHKKAAVREARTLRSAWTRPEIQILVYVRNFRKFATI